MKTSSETSDIVTCVCFSWHSGEKPWGAVCPTWTLTRDLLVSPCETRQGPDPGLLCCISVWLFWFTSSRSRFCFVFCVVSVAIHKTQPWFHGGVSRKEAQRLIEKQGLVDGWVVASQCGFLCRVWRSGGRVDVNLCRNREYSPQTFKH